jgi:hypothetical protein
VLAVIGIVGLLVYLIITPRIGESYSEFYILGPEGQADLYPRKIILGASGNISLVEYSYAVGHGVVSEVPQETCTDQEVVEVADNAAWIVMGITNRERQTMSYTVQVTINGTLHDVMGPIELANGENWEKRVGLVLEERGEGQKVEFKLFKTREVGEEDKKNTLLSLWLGTQQLRATVVNQGATDATYWLTVTIKGTDGQETEIAAGGPILIVPGGEWKPELDYASSGNISQRVEFSLYGDESGLRTKDNINKSESNLLFQESISDNYPSLQLWLDVT